MQIKKASFVISNTDHKKCPAPNKPEYAFIGRSNVGKSSLINKMTNRNSLAKVSSRPGKTQLINHFLINDEWYLVDLPGYGYAKVSKSSRQKWTKFVQQYLLNRENLYCLFVLVDSRHEPQAKDIEFINWLGEKGIPFALVHTKADKLSKAKLKINIDLYTKELLKNWEELPASFVTSSISGDGIEELLTYVEEINKENPI